MDAIKHIKTIFSTDLKRALDDARADERAKCEIEKVKALNEMEARIIGELSLKIKELESEIESMNFRLRDHEKEKKKVADDKQAVREVGIKQRRLVSDLIHMAEQKRDDDIRILQGFESLDTEVRIIENKLLGMDKSGK